MPILLRADFDAASLRRIARVRARMLTRFGGCWRWL